MALTPLQQLKLNLNEKEYPYFSDDTLLSYLEIYDNNVLLTSWRLCLLKASADDEIKVSGIELASNAEYWNNLATIYKTDYEKQQKSTSNVYKTSMRRADSK